MEDWSYAKMWFDRSDYIETLDLRSELTTNGTERYYRSS